MRTAFTTLAVLAGCTTMHGPGHGSDLARDSGDAAYVHAADVGPTPDDAALQAARDAVSRAEQTGAPSDRLRPWPLWEAYAARFVSDDGRVIDPVDGRTTSEGQSYALFFALVAGDQPRFERLLAWTEQNLAAGDLTTHLPAWHWGKRSDGSWGVLDENAASDADVWLAYTLLEASQSWSAPRYAALAHALIRQIADHEVVHAWGLGRVLLPGPRGFVAARGVLRLNPSYLVLPLFRRFEHAGVAGPWRELSTSSARVVSGSAPRGLSPDWIAYAPGRGFFDDPGHGPHGSYDAVRSYLWSIMVPASDPQSKLVQKGSAGLYALLQTTGKMPERIDVHTAAVGENEGPVGFLAVAHVYARARGDAALATQLRERLDRQLHDGLYGEPPSYYDQNLALFALGFADGLYQFAGDGHLCLLRNEVVCAPQ